MKKLELTTTEMELLIKTTDLLGKVNVQIAKMKNPFLLTYLLETVDSISSNSIEDIHTTVDLASEDEIQNNTNSPYVRYREALKGAHIRMENSGLILKKDIEWVNSIIRGMKTGYRKTPVVIKDSKGNVRHEGAKAQDIPKDMANLITLINEDWDQNAIVKSLLIHHKFEMIHPFSDGNGRTGRILFALLMNKFNILDIPASVFSYSVLKNKGKYYEALKSADKGDLNNYIKHMLEILNESLEVTLSFAIEEIEVKNKLINDNSINTNKNIESIIEWCFAGVKVSNKFLQKKTGLNNKTISKYIDILENMNIIETQNKGKYKPYKNLMIEKLLNKYFA